MSATLAELITTHQVEVDPHLDRQLTIPIHTGPQRQGDVIILPRPDRPAATTPVPAAGTPVVRGENGGNTHAMVGTDARCDLRTATADDLTLAILTVPAGATCYLAHPEHGYMGIGAGTYEIRRQREQADELRIVAD